MTEAFLARAMNVHGDSVYRLSLCRLQNKLDAEDAFQDTFLALFQEKEAESWEDEHLKAWLLRVAIHKCTDIARRRKRMNHVDMDSVPEAVGQDGYGWVELWDAVNRLPEKYRVIFHLYYGEGYKTQELADLLNLPGSTVRVYLNRARATLRKELGDHADIS